jgi:pimeloyl-ACP methyl ester carboxylesterase
MLNTLWLGLAFCATITLSAQAKTAEFKKGFVEVRKGQSLYVEHKKAKAGHPTVVVANGLTYSTRQWRSFVTELLALNPDLGVVLYDMDGMGETLLSRAPINYDIPLRQQTEDLRDLIKTLKLPNEVSIVGLSYGGAIALDFAANVKDVGVKHFIAMAPFLERLQSQDSFIKQQIEWHKFWIRNDMYSDEELYDMYLRLFIYTNYPYAEPILLENRYKLEAVYRMVKGAKNWNAIEATQTLSGRRVHVMAARDDEHVKFDRMRAFLKALPSEALASTLIMERTKHKIPEDRPALAAAWVNAILTNNPDLTQGLTFIAEPHMGEARSGDTVIPLPKENFCETILRTFPRPF